MVVSTAVTVVVLAVVFVGIFPKVADRLALGDVGAAGQDHERLAGLGALCPCGRRQTEQENEESGNYRPAHADHLQRFQSVSSGSVVNSTRIGTIGRIQRQHTLLFEDPRRLCW